MYLHSLNVRDNALYTTSILGNMNGKPETTTNDPYRHDDNLQESRFFLVLVNFIRAAELMEHTVLIPSVLMDLTVNYLIPCLYLNEIYLSQETDLRTFCLVVKSIKIQLMEGCSFFEVAEESDEENRIEIQVQSKLKELCKQLRPLIGQAKYLGYAAEELALSMKPVSFQEFTEQEHQHACLYDDHTTYNLRATLETCLHEADQMMEEILFPNLLKSFSASDYGCSMNKAEQTLYDLYVSLLQVRSVLLDSQNIHYENLENSTLYQTILKLKNVLCSYTSIVDKIVLKYLQEVHEDY